MMPVPRHALRPTGRRGFTLVEALAAILFMAIVFPVAIRGIRLASRTGQVAHTRMQATQLAESKLAEFVATGAWINGDQSDDFGQLLPGFRWELKVDNWDVDQMQVVTLTVYYHVQATEMSVTVQTLGDEAAVSAQLQGATASTTGTGGTGGTGGGGA